MNKLISILILFIVSTVFAENLVSDITYKNTEGLMVEGVRCATPTPTIEQQQTVQARIEEWVSLHGSISRDIITIPIAVHVVRGDNGEWDVTDTQIQDQIFVLNEAYLPHNFQFTLASIDRTDNSVWSQHEHESSEELAMKTALAVALPPQTGPVLELVL